MIVKGPNGKPIEEPIRLKVMTRKQLVERILKYESVIHQFGERIDATRSAARAEQREVDAKIAGGIWCLADVDGIEHDHIVTDIIAAAIRMAPAQADEGEVAA